MPDENVERFKIEQMRRFYEIFPYPSRPYFITPFLGSQMPAHGAFAKLIRENQTPAAHAILTKALRGRYEKKFQTKETLRKLEEIFPSSKKILLVGCGTDEPLLFRMLHPRNEISCIDLSKKNVKIARKKLFFYSFIFFFKFMGSKKPKTEFIVGDANVVLKQKYIEKFDYIQCFGVLHHQPEPEIMLSGIAEKLVEGGTLRMMVYSYFGRNIERKIQKRYSEIWNNISKVKRFKLLIFYNFFLLRIWQIFNFLNLKKSTSLRFKYLGLNSKIVADALMHPCDPGLCLENILPMAEKNNLRLIYCQAKVEDHGLLCGFENPLETWKKILNADRDRTLMSNPVLIFSKVSQ